jgi:endoglucanase
VHFVSDFEELLSYFLHMASVPSGEWTDRDTDQRPGTAPSSDGPTGHRAAPGRHRPPRRRRWLWTSGLASAVIGASLVTPWPSVTSATPVQPAAHQVSSTTAAARTAPTSTTSTRRTTAAPRPTTTTSTPRVSTTAPSTTSPAAPTPSTSAPTPSTPAPTTSTPAPTASPTASPTGTVATGNPLAGDTFYGPNTGAAAAATQPGRTAEEAALLSELARVPTALWLGAWSGDVTATVRQEVAAARAAGAVPVFVTYNVPGRDCGGYSAGGVDSSAAYLQWVQAVAAGIGTAEAVVVVEPDALAQLCGDPAARLSMLRTAVGLLEANTNTRTYLDAGHANWIDAATMAERLRAAGSAQADGFALNVSNFVTTASNVSYGQQVSTLLGGAHFVVDTSRNGNGPGSDWCNPPGRAVGQRPTSQTGQVGVDAFLWVKRPGESDGECNGGPAAGTFWASYAIGLMRGAA